LAAASSATFEPAGDAATLEGGCRIGFAIDREGVGTVFKFKSVVD
jgi:hypothetical protein